jgi:hypothetical protein
MNEQKKHNIYTQTDIQKYLSGSMSNQEMHAIEKAAMEDPLLAGAMEGYEGMEQKDWSKELAALKTKLAEAEHKSIAPVYSFRKWWRAAAAVIIIASGIAVTYLFNNNKSKEIAAIDEVAATDSVSAAKVDSAVTINSIAANEIVKDNKIKLPASVTATEKGKEENILLPEVKKRNESDSNFIYKPSTKDAYENKDVAAASNADDVNNKKRAGVANAEKESAPVPSNEAVADKGLLNRNRVSNNADNYINAQVVTADNKPVAFANVDIQKNNVAVFTDSKGNVKLPATDSVVSGVVTSAGYLPKKFSIKNLTEENKIVLQQDTVHVTAISSGRSKSLSSPQLQKNIENADTADEEDAEPAIGWYEYNNYINDNLVFPNEAKQKNIHGVVEVFVKLKNNGDISEIKVNKPLCPECDAEAIRLVKEGPKWEVKKNKAKKAKVKIRF